jgi:cytochrome P450
MLTFLILRMNMMWFTINAQPGPDLTGQRKIIRKAIGRQILPRWNDIIQKEVIELIESLSGFSGDPSSLLIG